MSATIALAIREDHIHLMAADNKVYANSELHNELRQREQTLQADLHDIHQKLANLTSIDTVPQPLAKPVQRRRNRRQRLSIPAPRILNRPNAHNRGFTWTAIDFITAFVCGFGVTLLIVPPAILWSASFALLTALATALLSRVTHLHDQRPHRSSIHEHSLILLTTTLSALGVDGAIHIFTTTNLHKDLFALDIVLTFAAMSLTRAVWRHRTAAHFKRGIVTRNVVIAGADLTGCDVRDYLTSLTYLGYCFKGFILLDETTPNARIASEEILGTVRDIIPLSRSLFVDEIIFTRRPETAALIATLDGARAAGIDVRLIPSVSETLQNRKDVHYVGDLPIIVMHQRKTRTASLFIKRILDLAAATIGIVATLPIWIAVAIAIKCGSAGPLFYSSNRVGFKGRIFPCYKFRTMVVDAEKRRAEIEHLNEREGILFKISNDPRITGVGKFLRKYSLDELPQLWNVLTGDMSMVGPRPPISSEVAQYELDHLRRLEVAPGITGLWQVEARHKASFENYIELDRSYVNNWSIVLDLSILLRTVKVVLLGTGT